MEMDLGVLFEPALVLLVRIEIVQDDVQLAARKGGNDTVHKPKKFDATPAFGMRGEYLSGGNLECGEQSRRAVALVIVALSSQGSARSVASNSLAPGGLRWSLRQIGCAPGLSPYANESMLHPLSGASVRRNGPARASAGTGTLRSSPALMVGHIIRTRIDDLDPETAGALNRVGVDRSTDTICGTDAAGAAIRTEGQLRLHCGSHGGGRSGEHLTAFRSPRFPASWPRCDRMN